MDDPMLEWIENGFSKHEADKWYYRGFTLEEALIWKKHGFEVVDGTYFKNDEITPTKAKSLILGNIRDSL